MSRDKNRKPRGQPDEEARLLARLEEQLDEIEMNEIVSGFTDEELEEKGFTGGKPIDLGRREGRRSTDREHLLFEEGVEFARLPDNTDLDDVDIEDIAYLADVEPGRLVATRPADEPVEVAAGPNIRKAVAGNRERFTAAARGKVLLVGDRLCLFPSDIDCQAEIGVSPDKMKALLTCRCSYGRGKPLSEELVAELLAERGISYGIDKKAIAKTVEEANGSGARRVDVVVARGAPPTPGEEGRPEYGFDEREQEYDFTILPDGRIDYKNTRNIVMADEGQLLARIIEPKEGIPGVDVCNHTVAAPKGAPASLYAGRGVRAARDGRELYAEKSGSVVLNGSILEVVDTYVVDGDVDYSSGNIRFNGNVLVNGNVREGFEVEAEGDIIVAMCVESARLEAGRDVIVRGGIQGKGKGLVSAGRDIRAGYAQNARMEAQGNIYIDSYAINSYMFTSKYLYMKGKQGVLIGGETFVQRGADVKTLGSENGIRTVVEVGTDYLVRRKIGELDEVVRFCSDNIAKIDTSLRGAHRMVKSGGSLPKDKAALIKKVLAKKKELEERRERVLVTRSDLEKRLREQDSCILKVGKTCYPDVFVKIRGAQMLVTQERNNIRFYDDRAEGTIKTGPY